VAPVELSNVNPLEDITRKYFLARAEVCRGSNNAGSLVLENNKYWNAS
jgi:hypothetical protein